MIIYICVQSESCRRVCVRRAMTVHVETEHKIWNLEGNVASAAAASLPEE